jgi:alkylation response protein AidB-like acyl-CoA dehydrogenase
MSTDTITTAIPGPHLAAAAAELGPTIAEHVARHDDEGTFVAEGFAELRRSGYLAAPVPVDLGGGGATTEQVAWAQLELARHDASTALASSMHLHVVLTHAWRYRHGLPGSEAVLRRVADDGLVVASTGGGDFTVPSGVARRTDGGWLVTGRKGFVSGAPIASVASTWAVTEDGEAIGFGVPLDAPGVRIVETWDAPGMRGTASHDVELDDVFIADERIIGRRAPGEFAPVLAIIGSKAFVVIAATYLGVATSARDAAVDRIRGTSRADDAGVRRTVGLMDQLLLSSRATLAAVSEELGDDPEPSPETLGRASLAKRAVIEQARTVGDLAMDAVGGRAYRRGDAVERAWRDLRAGSFHPLEHELTLRYAGDLALGRPPVLR